MQLKDDGLAALLKVQSEALNLLNIISYFFNCEPIAFLNWQLKHFVTHQFSINGQCKVILVRAFSLYMDMTTGCNEN